MTLGKLDVLHDGRGHLYIDVGNLRVTYLPEGHSGCDAIRIQAYRGDGSQSLHMGAELPIGDRDDLYRLMRAVLVVYHEGRDSQIA